MDLSKFKKLPFEKKVIGVLFGSMLLVAVLPVVIVLVNRNQILRSSAAPATSLTLSPAAGTAPVVGATFSVPIIIDAGVNTVVGTELHINYDQTKIRADSVTPGTFIISPDPVLGSLGATDGKMVYTILSRSTSTPSTGTGTLATIQFTALAAGAADISFDPLTIVGATGEGGVNALQSANGTTINVAAVTPSPSPIVCTPRPNLVKSPAPAMTATGLQVTVSAGTSDTVPTNTLSSINFSIFDNGTVTVDGTEHSAPFVYTVPAGTTQVPFLIKQVAPGQSTLITYVATDSCGTFSTFDGGGISLNWPNTSPTPTQVAATETLTPTAVTSAVTDFNPKTGAIGTDVTVTGTFNATGSNNYVLFNGTACLAYQSTATEIKVHLCTGATTGKLKFRNGDNLESAESTGIFTVSASNSPTPTTAGVIRSDIDNDGDIDIQDYALLFLDFGKSVLAKPKSDITSDGKVNILDYVLFYEDFHAANDISGTPTIAASPTVVTSPTVATSPTAVPSP